MSRKTEFYGLSKPEDTDYYDITIFNENADIIDGVLNSTQIEVEAVLQTVAAQLADAASTVAIEEGRWTPVDTRVTSSTYYTRQVGHYIKIGNTVIAYFDCYYSASSASASSAITITGLPYAADSYYGGGQMKAPGIDGYPYMPNGFYVDPATNYICPTKMDTNGDYHPIYHAGGYFWFNGTFAYHTSQ